MAACLASWPASAGTCIRVTVFELLCQTQAWRPLRIRSVSLIITGTASRTCAGSAYQTLIVCEPASSAVAEFGSAAPGSCGMPSDAVSTTVPVRAGSGPVRPATEASSCAGVRSGSSGDAWAVLIMVPAVTAAARTTAPPGTAHLARRENVGSVFIPNLTRPVRVGRTGSSRGPRAARLRPACARPVADRRRPDPGGAVPLRPVWARPHRLSRPAGPAVHHLAARRLRQPCEKQPTPDLPLTVRSQGARGRGLRRSGQCQGAPGARAPAERRVRSGGCGCSWWKTNEGWPRRSGGACPPRASRWTWPTTGRTACTPRARAGTTPWCWT